MESCVIRFCKNYFMCKDYDYVKIVSESLLTLTHNLDKEILAWHSIEIVLRTRSRGVVQEKESYSYSDWKEKLLCDCLHWQSDKLHHCCEISAVSVCYLVLIRPLPGTGDTIAIGQWLSGQSVGILATTHSFCQAIHQSRLTGTSNFLLGWN